MSSEPREGAYIGTDSLGLQAPKALAAHIQSAARVRAALELRARSPPATAASRVRPPRQVPPAALGGHGRSRRAVYAGCRRVPPVPFVRAARSHAATALAKKK